MKKKKGSHYPPLTNTSSTTRNTDLNSIPHNITHLSKSVQPDVRFAQVIPIEDEGLAEPQAAGGLLEAEYHQHHQHDRRHQRPHSRHQTCMPRLAAPHRQDHPEPHQALRQTQAQDHALRAVLAASGSQQRPPVGAMSGMNSGKKDGQCARGIGSVQEELEGRVRNEKRARGIKGARGTERAQEK